MVFHPEALFAGLALGCLNSNYFIVSSDSLTLRILGRTWAKVDKELGSEEGM